MSWLQPKLSYKSYNCRIDYLTCYKLPTHVQCYPNRVIEMPYAYQCCVYGACSSHKSINQWDAEQISEDDDLHKRTIALFPIHADSNCKYTTTFLCNNCLLYCAAIL